MSSTFSWDDFKYTKRRKFHLIDSLTQSTIKELHHSPFYGKGKEILVFDGDDYPWHYVVVQYQQDVKMFILKRSSSAQPDTITYDRLYLPNWKVRFPDYKESEEIEYLNECIKRCGSLLKQLDDNDEWYYNTVKKETMSREFTQKLHMYAIKFHIFMTLGVGLSEAYVLDIIKKFTGAFLMLQIIETNWRVIPFPKHLYDTERNKPSIHDASIHVDKVCDVVQEDVVNIQDHVRTIRKTKRHLFPKTLKDKIEFIKYDIPSYDLSLHLMDEDLSHKFIRDAQDLNSGSNQADNIIKEFENNNIEIDDLFIEHLFDT